MKRPCRPSVPIFLAFSLLICGLTPSRAADIDWSKVQGKAIKVFYPGVASWEFVHSDDHGTGAMPVRSMKTACADCHVGQSGEYDINADKIVAGTFKKSSSKETFEPAPPPGLQGFKDVLVKAAYDAENLYLWFQWQGSGASVTDPGLAKDDLADKLSVQINNSVKSFALYGCFMTCHNDENGMPEHKGGDVKLYTYYSREKDGSMAPQAKLDDFMSKGLFVDLLVSEFDGKEVKAMDEHILDARARDAQNDVTASGSFESGTYTLVVTRKLSTGDKEDIELKDGKTFYMGIAIHDNKNNGRKHFVSFPLSVGLSSTGDIAAQKL